MILSYTQSAASPTACDRPSLVEVATQILKTRRITRSDQRHLLQFHPSSPSEHTLINQVFDDWKQGLLRAVD